MTKEEFILSHVHGQSYSGPLTGFEQCKFCGGKCCKSNSCMCYPIDFGNDITTEKVLSALDSKKYMISFLMKWNDTHTDLIVIPVISAREQNCPENGIAITLFHTRCSLLTENGCTLPAHERPTMGLAHIPLDSSACRDLIDLPFEAWKIHQPVLDKVVSARTGLTTKKLFDFMIKEEAIYLQKALNYAVTTNTSLALSQYRALYKLCKFGYYAHYFHPFDAFRIDLQMTFVKVLSPF